MGTKPTDGDVRAELRCYYTGCSQKKKLLCLRRLLYVLVQQVSFGKSLFQFSVDLLDHLELPASPTYMLRHATYCTIQSDLDHYTVHYA